jgi:hypothetical protein
MRKAVPDSYEAAAREVVRGKNPARQGHSHPFGSCLQSKVALTESNRGVCVAPAQSDGLAPGVPTAAAAI